MIHTEVKLDKDTICAVMVEIAERRMFVNERIRHTEFNGEDPAFFLGQVDAYSRVYRDLEENLKAIQDEEFKR